MSTKSSYRDLIISTILSLKERSGSSRQAIKKSILISNKNLKNSIVFDSAFNSAIRKGVLDGIFIQPKGTSGPLKLNKRLINKSKPTTTTTKSTKISKVIVSKPKFKTKKEEREELVKSKAKSKAKSTKSKVKDTKSKPKTTKSKPKTTKTAKTAKTAKPTKSAKTTKTKTSKSVKTNNKTNNTKK